MDLNKEKIIAELGNIVDGDLNKTLAELNAIEKVEIENNTVQVFVKLIQPIQWIYQDIKFQIKVVLDKIAPDLKHEVFISEQDFDLSNRNTLKNVKNIIAVASGKGGVGKSAISSNIAAALSLKGAQVGILDGDVYGPSQPTMFGITDESYGMVEIDGVVKAIPVEKYGIKIASMGLVLNRDDAAIVRGPMLAGYFSMLFEQIEWGNLDFLIFDLPPGTGDIQLTLTQKIPLTGAVVVTTPQEIALADVRRSISMFNRVNVDVLGIVENMSYFVPEDMPNKKYYIFGKGGGASIADDFGVNLLGEVPLNIDMREKNDGGKPIVLSDNSNQSEILKEITAKMVKEVRIKNYKITNTQDLEISI